MLREAISFITSNLDSFKQPAISTSFQMNRNALETVPLSDTGTCICKNCRLTHNMSRCGNTPVPKGYGHEKVDSYTQRFVL